MKGFIRYLKSFLWRQEKSDMRSKELLKVRVESCIGTLVEVHESLKRYYGDIDFLKQFETLRDELHRIDLSRISERDVELVERATNALLGEFRPIFKKAGRGIIEQGYLH